MDGLSEIQKLIEIEALKDLKARRDYALDTKDWATYEAVHAEDHYSDSEGEERRDGAKNNTEWVAKTLAHAVTVHHSHSPVFEFDSPTKVRGIWGMEDNIFWTEDGQDCWLQGYGFYYETYEKRDGKWLFTSRTLRRQKMKVTKTPAAQG